MGVSYELSQREGRIGGPEKPLSELGMKGYARFWQARVARTVLGMKTKAALTIREIAEICWMLPEDVLVTLKEMELLTTKKKTDGSLMVSKARVMEWINAKGVDLTPPVHEDGFVDESNTSNQ